jgi:hypothetical protein
MTTLRTLRERRPRLIAWAFSLLATALLVVRPYGQPGDWLDVLVWASVAGGVAFWTASVWAESARQMGWVPEPGGPLPPMKSRPRPSFWETLREYLADEGGVLGPEDLPGKKTTAEGGGIS